MLKQLTHSLLRWQVQLIIGLQNLVGEKNSFLLRVSKMSDPPYVIAILFPVFASMNTELGMEILLVSALTEWINTILKWILMESRPFWWVREAKVTDLVLKQTDITCQTAPGSPSGHSMEAAAFLFVLIKWCSQAIAAHSNLEQKKNLGRLMWGGYFVILFAVALSRVNVAAHYPHQCILGSILGFLLAKCLVGNSKYSVKNWLMRQSKAKMLLWSTVLTALSFLSYFLHRPLGFDPGWSIKLAFKWCEKPETISVFTTPLLSLVRDCGCLLGLAIAWPLRIRKFYPVVGAVVATLFFVSTKMLRPLMPANDPFQFYSFQFLDNFFTSLCVLTIVPYVASLVKFKEKTK